MNIILFYFFYFYFANGYRFVYILCKYMNIMHQNIYRSISIIYDHTIDPHTTSSQLI